MLIIYTGDGKGKTTAAIGSAIRAAGAGYNVAFIQFDKGPVEGDGHYSERKILSHIDEIDVIPTGMSRIKNNGVFSFDNDQEDIKEAERGFDIVLNCFKDKKYFLIIADEIFSAVNTQLLTKNHLDKIIETYKQYPETHLLLTGRNAPQDIIKIADLVTEIKLVKHYFYNNTPSIRGLDY